MLHLLERLDALSDHVHAHVLREIDQRSDDGVGMVVDADGIDEHLVDLDDIDTELQHIAQSAVTSADVVDGYAHAEALQGGRL